MNIKTTIILLVLLLGVGAAVFFTRDKDTGETKPTVKSLVDVKTSDVTRFVIVGGDGRTIAAQKTGSPEVWKLTQPVDAALDTSKVGYLLDALTSLKSTAELSTADAPKTAFEKPQYVVDLYEGSKDTKLTIGDSLSVSGGVYVKIGGNDTVEVVSSSVVDSLDKPASDLRRTQLFDTASPSVQQLSITKADGTQTVLAKMPKGWQMLKPTTMPVDESAAGELASAVVNMTPVEFEDQVSPLMGLKKPQELVTFSSVAPSTQPTSQPIASPMPGGITVSFGGYDGEQMKNIFAQLPDGSVVKVAASVLDSLNKKPYEIRNKTVLDIDPVDITKAVVELNQPATTQPTTMPAVKNFSVLIHKHKPTTASIIGPTLPGAEWELSGPKPVDADAVKVANLLGHFHPLHAEAYQENPSTDKMVKTYRVTLFTSDVDAADITLGDPGNDHDLACTYNGLAFTVSRSVLTDLAADFSKPTPPPVTPATPAAPVAPSVP